MILVLGDFHINQSRLPAFQYAFADMIISARLSTHMHGISKFSKCIILGDITNTTPTPLERLTFVNCLNALYELSDEIVIIKGTREHDYTNGIYNFADFEKLDSRIKYYDLEYKMGDFIFGHYELEGAVYSNGMVGHSTTKPVEGKIYLNGHIHKPGKHYVGSIYKCNFGEENDKKRYVILNEETKEIESVPINQIPMVTIHLTGLRGEVKCDCDYNSLQCDKLELRVIAETDSETKLALTREIIEIKKLLKPCTYKESVSISDIVVKDIVAEDEGDALIEYCKQKKYDYTAIKRELSHGV